MKKKVVIFAIGLIMIASALFVIKIPRICFAGSKHDAQTGQDPFSSGSGGNQGGGTTAEFQSPIPWKTLPELIGHISDWLTGIIAGLAVIMIMVGGFQYVWHSGNASEAAKARSYIQNSLIGLILVLSVNMIIAEINYLLGTGGGDGSFFAFATRLIDWGILIISGLAVIFLMYAGFTYIMVGADSKNSEKAKNMIKYTMIGLVIALMSYAIVRYVVSWFGA